MKEWTMTERDVNQEVAELRKDLQDLRDEFASKAEKWQSRAEGAAARAASSLRESMGGGVDYVREGATEARDYGERIYRDLQQRIEAKPMSSAAIAFGIGLVVGMLMERR